MHKSSMVEMARFVERLPRHLPLKILDVGSCDVNGNYRALFTAPLWRYVGLDIEAGRNVDIVAADPYSWPVPATEYDVVISGQCAEHVEDLHGWIREVSRVVAHGGWVCVIAPWTHPEHRYPTDCWRIFPDGMRYLLETVARLEVVECYHNGPCCIDTVGIARKP